MKKLLAILAVAGFLTACSDGGTAEEAKGDSATTTATPAADSLATSTPAADSLVKPDSLKAAGDTLKH